MRVELQPAFVLHSRPFKDSSLLIDVFTQGYGRISLVAKGANKKKGGTRQLLNPFLPLLISYQGKSSLKTLTDVELQVTVSPLLGHHLYSGFYINELCQRLLPLDDSYTELFADYAQTLAALRERHSLEQVLRNFEQDLLRELGYDIPFYEYSEAQRELQPSAYYDYDAERGFRLRVMPDVYPESIFYGEHLLQIAQRNYPSVEVLRSAKRLTRLALQPLLGSKPLYSRSLFKKMV